jgi:hypothetical protein
MGKLLEADFWTLAYIRMASVQHTAVPLMEDTTTR